MLGSESAKATVLSAGSVPDDGLATLVPGFPRRMGEPQSVASLMRSHLDMARPRSDAEALRLLRQAFPAAPLAARVAAMAARAR